MKKKIMVLAAALMLMFGAVGQAMAYFEAGELVRVVYQLGGGVETATDLGAFSSTSLISGTTTYNTNNFDTSYANSGYQVAYFVIPGAGATTAWVSGPTTGQAITAARKNTGFDNSATNVSTLYRSLGTATITTATSNLQSYVTQLDQSTPNGTNAFFSNLISAKNGEANLAALSTVGYVDQTLYYYANSALAGVGAAVATIRTYADGHTALIGSSVPVPMALYLLGSGLIGLLGIRRKMVAA